MPVPKQLVRKTKAEEEEEEIPSVVASQSDIDDVYWRLCRRIRSLTSNTILTRDQVQSAVNKAALAAAQ